MNLCEFSDADLVGVRCGTFKVSVELLLELLKAHKAGCESGLTPDGVCAMHEVFGSAIVLDATLLPDEGVIQYLAVGPMFEPVEQPGLVPRYSMQVREAGALGVQIRAVKDSDG